MFFNVKQLVFQRINSSAYLEVDVETHLYYYIVATGAPVNVDTVDYKVEKASGRDTITVVDWTSVDISSVTDDTYDLPITVSGVTKTDPLTLTIKVKDTDGAYTFYKDNEVEAI